jgi:hypothetical protein
MVKNYWFSSYGVETMMKMQKEMQDMCDWVAGSEHHRKEFP